MMDSARLVRKTSEQMVAGVCAGLADYLKMDVTLVRLFFFLLLFAEGIGAVLYVVMWVVIPAEGVAEPRTFEERIEQGAEEFSDRVQTIGEDIRTGTSGSSNAGFIIGGGLIIVGLYYLLRVLPLNLPYWFDVDYFWPLLIIAAGVWLLLRRVKES